MVGFRHKGASVAKRIRSPNYPSIDLEKAILRASELYNEETSHPTTADVASTHWGYKSVGSGGSLILAALSAYGFIDIDGKAKRRRVKVSNFGRRIILDKRADSHERVKLLKEAVLRPTLHKDLWEKWGSDLPSDASMKHHLVAERGFNEKSVSDFIAKYKASLDFAELTNAGKMVAGEGGENEDDTASHSGSGAQGRQVFQAPAAQESRPALTPRLTMNESTFPLDEGQVVLQWPAKLSKESYEDLKVWLDLMGTRVARSVSMDDDDEIESE